VAVDPAQATWLAGDLHLRAPRQAPHQADRLVRGISVKDLDSHSVRALLASLALLVKIKRDLANQIRGLLKNLGLAIGRPKFNVFAARAEELIEDRPELIAAVGPPTLILAEMLS
jgi:transposase